MKKNAFIGIFTVILASLSLLVPIDGFGRGGGGGRSGGGGGARGGGGGARGSAVRVSNQNMSRSPSMSRPQVPQRNNYSTQPQRQARQQTGQSVLQQASSSQHRSQILSPSESRYSQRNQDATSIQQLGQSRQQTQQFLQNSNVGQRAAANLNSSTRNRDLNNLRQSLPATIDRQNVTANAIRQGISNGDRSWFNNSFWNDRGSYPYYRNNDANWWGAASWAGLNGYLGWGWNEPIYYQDGYPIYVNSTDGTNYLLTDPSQYPQNVAVNSGTQGASTASENRRSSEDADWMPLGVFALVSNVGDATAANMVFQLAISKEGNLSGSYYNTSSDQVYPVDGIVDRDTQMAVWKMAVGEGPPIFQTGIFNLTKDQTAVNVTYSDGSEQTWLMVRLAQLS